MRKEDYLKDCVAGHPEDRWLVLLGEKGESAVEIGTVYGVSDGRQELFDVLKKRQPGFSITTDSAPNKTA